MKLYDRDYTLILNDIEREVYYAQQEYDLRKGLKSNRESPKISHSNEEIRKFLWHSTSLFPNNYLHFGEYRNIDFEDEAKKFRDLIYSAKNEQEIQKYIKEEKKWFIPGGIFLDYNFGHHDAYLFPEQKLGTEYITDYMLIGKNSDGYNIVLIEFEKANTKYLLDGKNSMESESVRKGLGQIKAWKQWIEKDRGYFLRSIGLTQKGIDIPLPRIFYYLVVSRRDYMDQRALDNRSQTMYEGRSLKIVTFDRLVDNIRKLKKCHSW